MPMNLQNIEKELLEQILQSDCSQKFLELVADQARQQPALVLGCQQFRHFFPAAAAQLSAMPNVMTDDDPELAQKFSQLSQLPQLIFANLRVGGIEQSDAFKWMQSQPALAPLPYHAPLQDLFGALTRDSGEAWLREAADQEYKKKISYVVLSGFDNAETLAVMLQSFCDFTEPRDDNELIVILNGYTQFPQAAIDTAVARGFSVKTVFRNKNIGVALGFNEGIRLANGEYICCLQDDITFSEKNWDRELSGYLDQHADIGVIGGHCALAIFHADKRTEWEVPISFVITTIKGKCDWPLMAEALVEVDQTVCICMMVRRELAQFDWHYAPTGLDDLGVCMDARRKGYKVFATDVGIEHAMITSVIRGELDKQSAKSRNDLGMPLLRGYHYHYFVNRFGDLLRPAAFRAQHNIQSMADMAPHAELRPKQRAA